MLDGLDRVRKNIEQKRQTPDAVMGYYTTTIFRISYLDATPELLMGNIGKVNQDIRGLKAISEMNIYLAIINSNIYNVLYTHSKYGVGTLYGLVGIYQVYNTFEKEFLMEASPASVASYHKARQTSVLKPVIAYLDSAFKRMRVDSTTYTDTQWWKISGDATNQLKQLQTRLSDRVNNTLVNLESSEKAKVNRLLILLIISILLIAATVTYTIVVIRNMLTELRIAAEKISIGDTGLELGLYSKDVIGALAGSISKIDENNKMLAEAANEIGSGNFEIEVRPRAAADLLGNAISHMKNALQRFTEEKFAYAAELERLLEVIKQSESHFRQIADRTPFMIWQVNDKGETTYVNKPWLDYTGLDFKQSLGKGWVELVHPEDINEEELLKPLIDRVSFNSKVRIKNTAGEYRWMYVQGNPIFKNNSFDGFIGSLTDITDQLAAEQATRELMKKKDEFLSIASHELKTPLTSIKAYGQLLSKSIQNDEKSLALAGKTLIHVERLEKLIRDLLDVSRINSGQMDYDVEIFEFPDLLKQSVENFSDVSSKHRIVVKNIANCVLNADRVRIEQVFNNLLYNAAKYSPEADTIILNSYLEDGYVVVSVQDYGIGIAKRDWKQLFERFYRSEKSYNKFQGLGLGLFISSEIIKRHNGKIWVESELGKGSIFYFRLPLAG
jgi:PAS domain S-box-containing protein